VIGLNNIINDIKRCHHDIYSDHIPLWDCLPILNSGPGSSYTFFCPLMDSMLRTARISALLVPKNFSIITAVLWTFPIKIHIQ
jgi:hypothetical protein